MPKFFLIQPSLQQVGGHYYDFAVALSTSAEAAGYEPVLAVHRNFQDSDQFPDTWRAEPIFERGEAYMRPPRRTLIRVERRGNIWSSLARLHDWGAAQLRRRRWKRRIDGFQRACRELFERVPLTSGDQVLLASAGDLDMMGLAHYLQANPHAHDVDWRFLFHYTIFSGRVADYSRQWKRLRSIRKHFHSALRDLEGMRLHFHTTTERLADQYNRLEVADFRALPYPINPAMQMEHVAQPCGGPLRIICAGEVRREKGGHTFADLISQLWRDFLAPGRIQLFVQSNQTRKTQKLLGLPFEQMTESHSDYRMAMSSTAPVVLVPHPLSAAEYVDFIHRADIALFLYEGEAYYTRCSGILLEMLCAGVPVIVPAGSWLSEQINDSIQQHLCGIERDASGASILSTDDIPWNAAAAQGAGHERACTFGQDAVSSTDIQVPTGAAELLVTFRTVEAETGTSIRLDLERGEPEGHTLTTIIDTDSEDTLSRAMFHLDRQRDTVRLSVSNAYADVPVTIVESRMSFLAPRDGASQRRPGGSVGLIAADAKQIPELLIDMVVNHEHYLATARDLARGWRQKHHPDNTLRELLGDGQHSERAGRENRAA
jgi:glycosyltransferase involved in cell wall biosynthesis